MAQDIVVAEASFVIEFPLILNTIPTEKIINFIKSGVFVHPTYGRGSLRFSDEFNIICDKFLYDRQAPFYKEFLSKIGPTLLPSSLLLDEAKNLYKLSLPELRGFLKSLKARSENYIGSPPRTFQRSNENATFFFNNLEILVKNLIEFRINEEFLPSQTKPSIETSPKEESEEGKTAQASLF